MSETNASSNPKWLMLDSNRYISGVEIPDDLPSGKYQLRYIWYVRNEKNSLEIAKSLYYNHQYRLDQDGYEQKDQAILALYKALLYQEFDFDKKGLVWRGPMSNHDFVLVEQYRFI